MKHLILTIILFLTYSKAYSEECVFTGTVYPIEKTEIVRKMYNVACRFFTNTFNAKLDPNMKLDSVRYVNSWEGMDIISDKKVLYAIFHSSEDPLINDIYINPNDYGDVFDKNKQDKTLEDSIALHEMIHFFFKSANLKYLTENEIARNGDMEEVLAYWCQNQYIKEVTKDKKSIMSYIRKNGEGFKILDPDHFIEISGLLYYFSTASFMYQSIHFLDGDPREKYVEIVNNKYTFEPGPGDT